jgi:hypothetical protein
MRIVPMLAAFVLGAACASAQPEPTAGQARRLLQSQSLLNKAWGAWYAGASHNPALREPLLAALRRARSLSGSARDSKAYAYVQALFDALIQIPGVVPSEVILPFEANWRPEILILLSRDPRGAESDLLAMRERSMPEPEWYAVNALLFAMNSKPFFQKTLQEIQITRQFVIQDHLAVWCGGTTGCAVSTRSFPKGFPPIALYQFPETWGETAQPGDTLLLGGPVAICYRRTVVPADGTAEWSECKANPTGTGPRQVHLAQLFSAIDLLSERQSEELFHPWTFINWHGIAQAAAEMDKSLAEQAASIQALVENAQKRGLVQASGMRLTINTTVNDVRENRSDPLPAIASREIVIP